MLFKSCFRCLAGGILLLIISINSALAQDRYWVFFSDKNGVEFDPYTYLDNHTIEKRMQLGIPLNQFSDLPVRTDYLQQISYFCDSIKACSRWLNAAVIWASPHQLSVLSGLDFIIRIEPIEKIA